MRSGEQCWKGKRKGTARVREKGRSTIVCTSGREMYSTSKGKKGKGGRLVEEEQGQKKRRQAGLNETAAEKRGKGKKKSREGR
jgi:hypothetical protein